MDPNDLNVPRENHKTLQLPSMPAEAPEDKHCPTDIGELPTWEQVKQLWTSFFPSPKPH
jgi:hypothetical protein